MRPPPPSLPPPQQQAARAKSAAVDSRHRQHARAQDSQRRPPSPPPPRTRLAANRNRKQASNRTRSRSRSKERAFRSLACCWPVLVERPTALIKEVTHSIMSVGRAAPEFGHRRARAPTATIAHIFGGSSGRESRFAIGVASVFFNIASARVRSLARLLARRYKRASGASLLQRTTRVALMKTRPSLPPSPSVHMLSFA